MLVWDLAGIGVVSWILAIRIAASAIGYAVALLGLAFPRPPSILFAVSWVAIGVSLIRGGYPPRATGA